MPTCPHEEARKIGVFTAHGFARPETNLTTLAAATLIYCPSCEQAAWNEPGTPLLYHPVSPQQLQWITWADADHPA